jgi:hypothetical protein
MTNDEKRVTTCQYQPIRLSDREARHELHVSWGKMKRALRLAEMKPGGGWKVFITPDCHSAFQPQESIRAKGE